MAGTTTSNLLFILVCNGALPSQLKNASQSFQEWPILPVARQTPPPAPGAFYPAAMKTSPHKANPLPIPPSWFQLHNEPNQGRLSGQFLISSELPHPYSGSHSSGDSFTSGVSFVIYHPATSEILSHQWQQQPPWLSRVLTHRKLKPWDNGCFLPPEACYLKKEHIMLMPKGELRYSLFTDPCL